MPSAARVVMHPRSTGKTTESASMPSANCPSRGGGTPHKARIDCDLTRHDILGDESHVETRAHRIAIKQQARRWYSA